MNVTRTHRFVILLHKGFQEGVDKSAWCGPYGRVVARPHVLAYSFQPHRINLTLPKLKQKVETIEKIRR
jgi:hypothetical protein